MIFDAYEIDNRLMPNMYRVHTEGGSHMFAARCLKDKELHGIYKKNIWPFVEKISRWSKFEKQEPIKKTILYPGLTLKDPYPRYHFRTIEKINGKNDLFLYFHQLLAGLLDNKILGGCVNHKNGKPSDYRLENLEWVTLSGNAKGIKIPRLDYGVIYDSFIKNKYI
jgi:hypothetical protein